MSKSSVSIGINKNSVEFGTRHASIRTMHRFVVVLLLLALPGVCLASTPANGRISKVLPLYLDQQGHDALSPSLFDRDAYQVRLRDGLEPASAVRFDVLWTGKAHGTGLKLRVEARGVDAQGIPRQVVLEKTVKSNFFGRWTSLTLGGEDFKHIGSLIAWRVTLWSDNQMVNEQKSFLW